MVKCEMNKTQKIIKTFFLTLFVTIVCMCSTVFAASEPIGSINYPASLKVGGNGVSYTYKDPTSNGYETKNLGLQLIELKKGAEAEAYVKSQASYYSSSTPTSCWYLFKIRLYYISSSETTATPISASDLIYSSSFYSDKKTQLTHPEEADLYLYTSKNYRTDIYPGTSTNPNYIDFYYGILLDNCTSIDYPIIKLTNYSNLREVSYVSTNPNYSVGKDITKTKITGLKHKAYTGKAQSQSLTIKDGSTTLKKDVDYKLSYKNNTKVGEAIVRIIGIGKYAGVSEQYFFITPAAPKSLTVSNQTNNSISLKWTKDSTAYGYKIYMYKPSTKKWVCVKTTYSNTAYIYTDASKKDLIPCYGYKFRVSPYIHKISSATGKYTDVNVAYRGITAYTRPTKSKITKATRPAKRTVSLTWVKSPRVSGYQVIVYKAYGLKNVVKTYYTKGTSKKVTGLTSGKWYYVAVRPYKTINGKKLYSDSYEYYYSKIK